MDHIVIDPRGYWAHTGEAELVAPRSPHGAGTVASRVGETSASGNLSACEPGNLRYRSWPTPSHLNRGGYS